MGQLVCVSSKDCRCFVETNDEDDMIVNPCGEESRDQLPRLPLLNEMSEFALIVSSRPSNQPAITRDSKDCSPSEAGNVANVDQTLFKVVKQVPAVVGTSQSNETMLRRFAGEVHEIEYFAQESTTSNLGSIEVSESGCILEQRGLLEETHDMHPIIKHMLQNRSEKQSGPEFDIVADEQDTYHTKPDETYALELKNACFQAELARAPVAVGTLGVADEKSEIETQEESTRSSEGQIQFRGDLPNGNHEPFHLQANLELDHAPSEAMKTIEVGDIVMLDIGVPREYCNHEAIVTKAGGSHCTVVVLDETGRYGIGECWPNYENIELHSSRLRLGAQVVVSGLQSARIRHLNGQVGVISRHPRQGHPSFITKPACPNTPQLNVCVSFHDESVKERSALLEPRFLTAWQDACESVTRRLSETSSWLLLSDGGFEKGSGSTGALETSTPEAETTTPESLTRTSSKSSNASMDDSVHG